MIRKKFGLFAGVMLTVLANSVGADDEFMLGDGADGGMGLQSFFSQVITGGEVELPKDVDLQVIAANDPE